MPAPEDNPLEGLTAYSDSWKKAVYVNYGHYARLGARRVLRGRNFDATDEDDIAQDVFLEIMEKQRITSSTESIAALFRSTGRQRAVDRVRRDTKMSNDKVDPEELPAADLGLDEVEANDWLERASEIVRANQRELKPKERRVLSALAAEEPQAAIAAREGMTREGISMMKKRIRRKVVRGLGILPTERRGD